MHVIYQTVAKLGAHFNPDDAIKFMRSMAFDSPRGPLKIDEKTRDVIQNVYLRKVESRGGKLVNINFETIPMVRDPWKDDHPE
jgi:branched-chain amino acid transport system substrate-binding protein